MPTPASIASAVDQPVTSRPCDFHAARVRRVHAAQHAHQRRLARAVLADERVNLAARDLERRAAVRLHGAERLVDVGESIAMAASRSTRSARHLRARHGDAPGDDVGLELLRRARARRRGSAR